MLLLQFYLTRTILKMFREQTGSKRIENYNVTEYQILGKLEREYRDKEYLKRLEEEKEEKERREADLERSRREQEAKQNFYNNFIKDIPITKKTNEKDNNYSTKTAEKTINYPQVSKEQEKDKDKEIDFDY